MTTARTTTWAPLIRKELRALLPAWLVTTAILLFLRRDSSVWLNLSLVAFVAGTAAVGSLSVGHEFLHGTLASLLAQPRRRRELLLAKLAVLVPLQAALAVLFQWKFVPVPSPIGLSLYIFAILAGLFVAPWLTMACRSALGGTVFTVATEGACLIAGALVGPYLAVVDPLDADWDVALMAACLVCLAGAVMSWRLFLRLEAIDSTAGRSGPVSTRRPATCGAAPRLGGTRPRVWLLIVKELRLQLPSVAVAALYAIGTLLVAVAEPRLVSRVAYAITPLYIAINALLVGALSSAEERQLGTAEWQVMLPMSTIAQWLVKIAATLAATVVLTLITPAVVMWTIPTTRIFLTREAAMIAAMFSVALVLIGLYVSSLSRNSLGAFLAAVLTAIAVCGFAAEVRGPQGPFRMAFIARLADRLCGSIFLAVAPQGYSKVGQAEFDHLFQILGVLVVIAPFAAAVYFAMRNHRSADRGARRVVAQVLWMFACVVIVGSGLEAAAIGRSWDPFTARAQRRRVALQQASSQIDGRVGVCSLVRFSVPACVNPTALFPMAGTWRVPVVIAALKAVDAGTLQLDDPTSDLLRRALVDDGAASNLATRLGGTLSVEGVGVSFRSLMERATANRSHRRDITTPLEMADLLVAAGTPYGRLLTPASTERLRDLLNQTSDVGRIRATVPAGWTAWQVIATSGEAAGAAAATSDLGLLRAPDGQFIAVAVFVADSRASAADRAAFFDKVIGAIAAAY